ncbi:MAG: multicopper oxidase domain-containing protein [Alphaproteobacteria bacterium]|nr:multicopper oxidase domain-containing protein [Alphaproteobacteria bacterium]
MDEPLPLHFGTLLVLGFVAGATILLGLPIGRLKSFSPIWRNSLSMLAAGILVFLLVEILGEATGQTALAFRSAPGGASARGVLLALLLVGGFWAGFVGLVGVEQRLIRGADKAAPEQLSFMIAIGIGLHNLSEGLAIGQAYLQGLSGLTFSLIVGFALHNATEGFGIVGPVLQRGQTLSWRTLLMLALIGGGPTFAGTLLGSLWTSPYLSVAVLAMAGGALLYVLKELFAGARKEARQMAIMTAVAAGFIVGWSTELVADAGLTASSSASAGTMVDADGDVIAIPPQGLGPHLSRAAITRQNDASNATLHEKALKPELLPDGTHRFVLTASVFPWMLYPGVTVEAWGYNHQVPGPLLRFYVGEKVEIVVHNQLPQPTTVHWHGMAVPNAMDGVPGVTQRPIPPGDTFTYRFTVTKQMIGTHHYHSHVNDDFQMDQGLNGPLIVDPAPPAGDSASSANEIDALYVIGAFKVGGSEEENAFVLNGKAYPEAPTLVVPEGAKVRLRLINASAEQSHVMHLHGYTFQIVALDGNPLATPIAANTITLGAAQTADIVFTADNLGSWMFHCHILDHTINPGPYGDGSAAHMVGMGGLVTFVDVVSRKSVQQTYVPAGSMMHSP